MTCTSHAGDFLHFNNFIVSPCMIVLAGFARWLLFTLRIALMMYVVEGECEISPKYNTVAGPFVNFL